jgi:hypothetical protein
MILFSHDRDVVRQAEVSEEVGPLSPHPGARASTRFAALPRPWMSDARIERSGGAQPSSVG